jgi:hypothetical protein
MGQRFERKIHMVSILIGFVLLLPLAVHRWGADSRDFTDPRVAQEISAMAGLDLASSASGPTRPTSRASLPTEIHGTVIAMQVLNRPVAPAA